MTSSTLQQPASEAGTGDQPGQERSISLLGMLAVFVRHWRSIALGIAGGILLALLYVLVLPRIYTARVVIVPSIERSSASILAAQLPAGLANLAGAGNQEEQKLIMAIVRSRRLADSVYHRVNEGAVDPDEREFFIRQLGDRTEVQQTAAGSYVIQVRDREPERAAAIANSYPALINSISGDLRRQAVAEKMDFLRQQLADARVSLLASEEQLLTYQRTTEVPAIEEQARQTVEAAAELQRLIIQKEIEVSQLRRSATPTNPEFQQAQSELGALRAQLRNLRGGQATGVFVPLGESAELKVGEVRLMREFMTNEQIYLALTAALADAQIDARSSMPVVSVLDQATVPKESSRLSAPIAFFLFGWVGLVGGLLLALLSAYRERLRSHPDAELLRRTWAQETGGLRRSRA